MILHHIGDKQRSNAHVGQNAVPYFGLPGEAGKRQHTTCYAPVAPKMMTAFRPCFQTRNPAARTKTEPQRKQARCKLWLAMPLPPALRSCLNLALLSFKKLGISLAELEFAYVRAPWAKTGPENGIFCCTRIKIKPFFGQQFCKPRPKAKTGTALEETIAKRP